MTDHEMEALRVFEVSHAVPVVPPAAPVPEHRVEPSIDPNSRWGNSFIIVFLAMLVISLATLIAYQGLREDRHQELIDRRTLEIRLDAEAAYRRRQGELKAESEAATEALLLGHAAAPASFNKVVTKVMPSIVSISSSGFKQPDEAQLLRAPIRIGPRDGRAEPEPRVQPQTSFGAGVLVRVDEHGQAYVLTANHVVENYNQITLTLASGQKIDLKTTNDVFKDQTSDLALLTFDASKMDHLVVAEFAPDEPNIGDWVLAVGNPFNLNRSVTLGIVSAKDRMKHDIVDVPLLQTDAAINPGNSGGPLFDDKGRIMGIVVSNLSKSGNHQGVGFAVVAAYAKIAMEDLLRPPHRVQRGFLGVGLEHLGSDEANVLNIEGGVIVKEVLRDHPAERAGLKARDVLVRINGQQVKDMNHARQLISSTRPGIEIPIGLLRFTNQKSPELLTLRVTLDERVDPAR